MLPKITGPTILCLHEKHVDRYFVVSNSFMLCRAAYQIVLERTEEGWYEVVDTKEILNNSASLPSAYDYLESRSDYQYEGMELIYPEEIE